MRLLNFVPPNAISALVNDRISRYSDSHLAVDCSKLDILSGKRVMVESTFGFGLHNRFLDEYGERKFVCIPLEKVGVTAGGFYECIRSKLGEKSDDGEA